LRTLRKETGQAGLNGVLETRQRAGTRLTCTSPIASVASSSAGQRTVRTVTVSPGTTPALPQAFDVFLQPSDVGVEVRGNKQYFHARALVTAAEDLGVTFE